MSCLLRGCSFCFQVLSAERQTFVHQNRGLQTFYHLLYVPWWASFHTHTCQRYPWHCIYTENISFRKPCSVIVMMWTWQTGEDVTDRLNRKHTVDYWWPSLTSYNGCGLTLIHVINHVPSNGSMPLFYRIVLPWNKTDFHNVKCCSRVSNGLLIRSKHLFCRLYASLYSRNRCTIYNILVVVCIPWFFLLVTLKILDMKGRRVPPFKHFTLCCCLLLTLISHAFVQWNEKRVVSVCLSYRAQIPVQEKLVPCTSSNDLPWKFSY